MACEFTFRPLVSYPKKRTTCPRRAPFSAGYGKNLMDLERELEHLRAKCCIVEADTTPEHIRLDGRLRSDAKLRSQAIVLRIETPTGWITMPCDTFDRWTDNLRAIVLTLVNLRAIDRYGVTKSGEQYRGWKQLPGGDGSEPIAAAEWATAEDAARMLFGIAFAGLGAKYGEVARILADEQALRTLFRDAARLAHPDAGGSNELMAKVNRARDFIEAHAGRAA